jgi:cation transport ATPase
VNLADYIRDSTMEHSRKAISEVLDYQRDLALAAAAEQRLNHPVAQAIVREALARDDIWTTRHNRFQRWL